MTAIIDMQGFRGVANEFIVKEIAIIYGDDTTQHFILYPPYEFNILTQALKKQVTWLYQYYHGLSWNGGAITLDDALRTITMKLKNHNTIYVKHLEKELWLKELLKDYIPTISIVNLDDVGCPNIQTLKKSYLPLNHCSLHKGCCAFQNAFLYKSFINKYVC